MKTREVQLLADTPCTFIAPFILLAISVWLVGCSTATNPRAQVEKASNPNGESISTTQDRRFRIYRQASFIMGQPSTDDSHTLLGEMTINLSENKVYWRSNELYALRRDGNRLWFFAPVAQWEIQVPGEVDREDKVAQVSLYEVRAGFFGKGVTLLGSTKREDAKSFVEMLRQLQVSEDTLGLVATSKFIDGNVIEMRPCQYAAKLKVDGSDCLLNGVAATIFVLQTSSGARALVVSTGQQELVVWPTGGWLLYNVGDAGLAVGGFEAALEKPYLKMRAMAKGLMPKEAEDRRKRIPKELFQNRL